VTPPSSPILLPVEVISELPPPDTVVDKTRLSPTALSAAVNASSCCIEFRFGKMTLDNPSPELLTVVLHELNGSGSHSLREPGYGSSPA